jgi:hypothetical protein
MAQAELDQLGDLYGPQYRYENYAPDSFAVQGFQSIEQPQGDDIRRGCMVPFEMFVLRARLQGYLGDTYEAIDQLYELIMRSKKVRFSTLLSSLPTIMSKEPQTILTCDVFLTFCSYSLRLFARSVMTWWASSSGKILLASYT